MSQVLKSQNEAPETGRIAVTITYSSLEVRAHHYGLHCRPRMSKHHDAIWVVVDRLTKATHFFAIKVTLTAEQLADLYIKEVVSLHWIPLTVMSNCDTKFSSKFWHGFQTAMGTELYFSTAYRP